MTVIQMLTRVGDCGRLAIVAETLPDDVADRMLPARRAALDAGLELPTSAAAARDGGA